MTKTQYYVRKNRIFPDLRSIMASLVLCQHLLHETITIVLDYVIDGKRIHKQQKALQRVLATYANPIVQHDGIPVLNGTRVTLANILNVYIKNHFHQEETIHDIIWMFFSYGIYTTYVTARTLFQACLVYYFKHEDEFQETRYGYLGFGMDNNV